MYNLDIMRLNYICYIYIEYVCYCILEFFGKYYSFVCVYMCVFMFVCTGFWSCV